MIFSVSVDLDGLGCYAAIHGLEARTLDRRALEAVPVVALERLCELFAELDVRATFFAIGREVDEIGGASAALRRAAVAGHEIGSHSYAHDYALSRSASAEIEVDLRRADESIERATGLVPRGFRAPGYTLTPALLSAIAARGYAYDSSLLPSPAYYAAKAVAIGLHALRGRRSHSILGPPAQLIRPRGPHWIGAVRELPIATVPLARLPVIGTLVVAVPEKLAASLLWSARAGSHLNLELHGIDVLDAGDGAPAALAAVQPGLKMPASRKMQRLRALLTEMKSRAQVATLESAAATLLPGVAASH